MIIKRIYETYKKDLTETPGGCRSWKCSWVRNKPGGGPFDQASSLFYKHLFSFVMEFEPTDSYVAGFFWMFFVCLPVCLESVYFQLLWRKSRLLCCGIFVVVVSIMRLGIGEFGPWQFFCPFFVFFEGFGTRQYLFVCLFEGLGLGQYLFAISLFSQYLFVCLFVWKIGGKTKKFAIFLFVTILVCLFFGGLGGQNTKCLLFLNLFLHYHIIFKRAVIVFENYIIFLHCFTPQLKIEIMDKLWKGSASKLVKQIIKDFELSCFQEATSLSTEPLAGDGGVCSGLPLQGQGGEGGGSHWHQASPSPNPPSPALGLLHTCAIKGEQAIT